MSEDRALAALADLGIPCEITRHIPVYTIEEMDAVGLNEMGLICKNLFLRDAKGKRHFLIVLHKDKKADLQRLQEQIGCTRLGFASEEKLMRFLGLEKGAVTPLGVVNDASAQVEVYMDRDLKGVPRLGVHPNVNTATVWISHDDLVRVIEANGNRLGYVDVVAPQA